MKRLIATLALAGAALCGCEAEAVADVTLNGLVDVVPVVEKGCLSVDVRNGTPVDLISASVVCRAGEETWSASISRALKGGHRIRLKAEPKRKVPAGASAFCGFIVAELDSVGRFIAPQGEPQAVIPSPEFHP